MLTLPLSLSLPPSLFSSAVWSCPAAWTQSRHAQPPLCSLHKGKAEIFSPVLYWVLLSVLNKVKLSVFEPSWDRVACVVFAGWSDGAECHAQIQEEICHLSALQAYLNLRAHRSAFRKQHVCILLYLFGLFCIILITFSQKLHWGKFTGELTASGCGLWLVPLVHRALNQDSESCGVRWWVEP